MYCIGSLLKGEKPILTSCEQKWDYLNCRDAATAFYLLGEKGKTNKIYNIGSGITKPLLDYVYTIRDAINPNTDLGIGGLDYAPGQVMHLCPDISALKNDTGFVPKVSFLDGLHEAVVWVNR